ncbi:MAG: class I SAM-dependent methyltransferase [Actinobacteria bacterium]|nr:class I SAM-dependent methyltransferase [Actinomycetota bacterium]
MSFERQQRDWEDLAALDPLWAVMSYRDKKLGRWDQQEFLDTGRQQMNRHLARSAALGYPRHFDSVLDFGCGVGRLAPVLSSAFTAYHGVDISAGMVTRARELHPHRDNCTFSVVSEDSLSRFPDSSFDFVVTFFVLQHVAFRVTILAYIAQLVRVLRGGGMLVFQLPARIPPAEKFLYDARRRLWKAFRGAGTSQRLLHRYLALSPMVMNFVPETDVVEVVRASDGELVDLERTKGGMAISDRTYYVTRRAS